MGTPEAISATVVRVAAEFVVFQVHLDMVLGVGIRVNMSKWFTQNVFPVEGFSNF